MPDYGHELKFGAFVTPVASDPDAVVSLARTSEDAGLDLVSFQDHPYQAQFLDTWTLLNWVAAATRRITVAPNVLNLPLRPPAVVARAAASLDLLSGGRLELGIGAGGVWDAIEAMGGRRLTPSQGVLALEEAIEIIRGLWASSELGGLHFDGTFYQVNGVRRGPRPAHDIGIWAGAYKRRMLRLTGRQADGWLPTLGYIQAGDLAGANQVIDDAAVEAGRNPGEIKRLLNLFGGRFGATGRGFLDGPPRQWVDQLLPLVVDEGFSTFILGSDDPTELSIFAREVAPALREAAAAERRAAPGATPRQGTATLPRSRTAADRTPASDSDALPEKLRSIAVRPGDPTYERVRHSYTRAGSPELVFRCGDGDDVVAALAFARTQAVPLSVRSGGHGISGRSTNNGGIIIDLSRMNSVEVLDRVTARVWVQAGARWGDVAVVLGAHGLAMSSGDYCDVGVGGLATAGGIGWLARKYGLTIDHVVAADIVLADGTVVRADSDHHPDLFWALRGAGGNFGVVTAFEFEAYEVGDVVFGTVLIDASDTAGVLERWAKHVEDAPRELSSFLSVFAAGRGRPPAAQMHLVYAGDDVPAAEQALTPFFGVGPILGQQVQLVPYAATVHPARNSHTGAGLEPTHSGLANHITPELAAALGDLLSSGDAMVLQIRSAGGAVNDVPRDATAYAHRTQNFSVIAATAEFKADRLKHRWNTIRHLMNGLYLSFETDTDPARLFDAFPEPTLTRLRELKARYDPDDFFNRNFAIPPAES